MPAGSRSRSAGRIRSCATAPGTFSARTPSPRSPRRSSSTAGASWWPGSTARCRTTLELSNAPAANQIRRFVCERAAAGDSKGEIKDKLVADFGPGVLASPPTKGFDLLAWVLPLLALGAGAAVLAGLVVRWSRRREPEPASDGEPSANGRTELDQRLEDELARFE